MGTAEVKGRFGPNTYDLTVNTHQLIILLLFNDREEYTCQEIQDRTQIPFQDLERQLQSLTIKNKILLRRDKGKDVAPTDVFQLNNEFTSSSLKVKVMTVSAPKESEVAKKQAREKVDDDRRYEIEAAVMRVMKARQVLEHNNLVAEVVKQLNRRFNPSLILIKQRIENLINRDFLCRSPDNNREYRYVA
jgi:cullin 3